MPFDVARELGRSFCAAEPSTVLVKVEATEREWAQEGGRQGEEYIIGLLDEYRAAWSLIRQWVGHDAAVPQREAEIRRLERLVWDVAYALQKAELDSEATRLRRAAGTAGRCGSGNEPPGEQGGGGFAPGQQTQLQSSAVENSDL